MARKFTDKQLKFIELFNGSATEAARLAGFKQPHSQGPRLLENVGVMEAIRQRERSGILGKKIATREERQEFWTKQMLDDRNKMQDRLKASELLGKSQADFTDKVEHTGANGGPLTFRWGGEDNESGD